ncbi:hypothetical protein CPB85DRAFT_1321095 [Mucidula mucida]|nr:hypothetical protein CPB85DRAFT_1321095 [Mucidula mucida]
MIPPSLPENFEDLDETEELYFTRLIHYHYVDHTEECNEVHYKSLTEPLHLLRRDLFNCASAAWMGETLALKVALIAATENWETLTGGSTPYPVTFDAVDVLKTMGLEEYLKVADEVMETCWKYVDCEPEGWVPTERHEEARTVRQRMREGVVAATQAKESAITGKHWPLDDMDEEKYM